MTDMINPAHYRGDRKFEPIAVIEDWGLNYRLGNAVKYISRNGRKPGEDPREGIKKAIWYLERELASYDEPVPYAMSYEDVLQEYAACAAEGSEPRESLDDVWAEFDLWDPSVGPIEPPPVDYLGGAEWDAEDPEEAALQYPSCEVDLDELHRDLDQFENDEIVSTFERRGLIFGVDKNGRTYTLGVYGGPAA